MESKRLKVLVWFVGSRGDVMPGVGISKALQDRGHEVAMGVAAGPEESIRAYGIRCLTLSKTPFHLRDDTAIMSEEELQVFRRSMNARAVVEVEKKYGVSWNLDECMPEATQGCIDLMQKERFDVIVCTVITQANAVRLLKLFPHLKIIRTSYSFGTFAPPTRGFPPGGYTDSSQCFGILNKLKHFHFLLCRFLPFITQAANSKRELDNVQKIKGIDHEMGYGLFKAISELPQLGLWSEHLQPTPSDFPDNLVVTGCVFTPQLDSWKPSQALEAFMQRRDGLGRKPAVISFGSMMGTQKVESSTLSALQRMGMNVVRFVSRKPKQLERTDFSFTVSSGGHEAGAGVFELDYAPFDWLLPQASVLICHGGAGTTFRSLWAGVPVVICPMISALLCDQQAHGEWAERRRLGTWIEPLAPSVEQCQKAVEQALACKENCAEVSAKMQREDGAAAAAAAIERLALAPKTEELASTCCIA